MTGTRNRSVADRRLRRWRADLGAVASPAGAIDAAFAELLDRYAEPHRRYHTMDHVAAVLGATDWLLARAAPAPDPASRQAIALAAWYHDAIYDPERPGNEAASAALAATVLDRLGVPQATVAATVRLIELTAGHDPAPGDRAGAVLIDADLSILGATARGYDTYARGVRAEYDHVPDDAFRAGRAAVLEQFLGRPHLFLIGAARARWDASARANLARELTALRA